MAVIKITIVMPYMERIWHIRIEMSVIPFLFCNTNPCPCWGLDMILPGVLKTKTPKTSKTPKTPKLENKDPHIGGSSKITTSRSPMRLQVERWLQEL